MVSFEPKYRFLRPAGLAGERDGHRGGVMEGGYEEGSPRSCSLPSISDSPIDVRLLYLLTF